MSLSCCVNYYAGLNGLQVLRGLRLFYQVSDKQKLCLFFEVCHIASHFNLTGCCSLVLSGRRILLPTRGRKAPCIDLRQDGPDGLP